MKLKVWFHCRILDGKKAKRTSCSEEVLYSRCTTNLNTHVKRQHGIDLLYPNETTTSTCISPSLKSTQKPPGKYSYRTAKNDFVYYHYLMAQNFTSCELAKRKTVKTYLYAFPGEKIELSS